MLREHMLWHDEGHLATTGTVSIDFLMPLKEL